VIRLELDGSWEMKQVGEGAWMSAYVPGSVYADLMRQGRMEDPFFRDNWVQAKELSRFNYEYRRTFTVDNELLAKDRVVLLCEGLDTLAEISLNGKGIAKTDNMHRTYEFDVKSFLREGDNEIHVLFNSPLEFVDRCRESKPEIWGTEFGPYEGFSHIRKAHCMFGWDWGPVLPDMGIWRSIGLQGYSDGRLHDVYITQHHTNGQVELDIRFESAAWSNKPLLVEVAVVDPQGREINRSKHYRANLQHIAVVIENPELWWPNGYGGQPLYQVAVALMDGERILDERELTIGLRTITWRREPDEYGESFEVVVNGISIFAKGANYIPEDNILNRITPERTERTIVNCVEAHFNMLRVWGGAYFQADYFYDLCDKYGLLIWQDLLFACATYDMSDEFTENIKRETADNVRRLRHHASLAIWCGNNEMEWAWVEWGFPKTTKLRADYIKQFEVVLPSVVKELDPNTFYWLASPSSGGGFDDPNDPTRGDVHFWDVWHGTKPFTEYRKHLFRFCSEFGFQSFPDVKTIESFTMPEDRNVFSYVMEKHQCHPEANGKILNYLAQLFKYPKDLDSLVYASQLVQAEAIRYGVDFWRQNYGVCMGAVYWQLNDCWPVASWSSIDYYGRWKALHYAAKRFFQPLYVSAREDDLKVDLYVTNETLIPVHVEVLWSLRGSQGKVLEEGVIQVDCAKLSSMQVAALDFSSRVSESESRDTYVAYRLMQGGELVSRGTALFVRPKHFNFVDPEVRAAVLDEDERFVIQVTAEAFAKYVELSHASLHFVSSDNFFDLSGGESIAIHVSKSRLSQSATLDEFVSGLRLRSLFDIS